MSKLTEKLKKVKENFQGLDHKQIVVYSIVVGAIMAFFLGREYVNRDGEVVGYALFSISRMHYGYPISNLTNTILAFLVFAGITYIVLTKINKQNHNKQ